MNHTELKAAMTLLTFLHQIRKTIVYIETNRFFFIILTLKCYYCLRIYMTHQVLECAYIWWNRILQSCGRERCVWPITNDHIAAALEQRFKLR